MDLPSPRAGEGMACTSQIGGGCPLPINPSNWPIGEDRLAARTEHSMDEDLIELMAPAGTDEVNHGTAQDGA
jgi:hypothetical protein